MWFFPTRKRPALCQRLLDACVETGMTSPGMVVVDGIVEGDYKTLRLPPNVILRATNVHMEFGGVLRWIFANFPDEDYYGLVGDDGIPRTPRWDRELVETAGSWAIALSNSLLPRPDAWTYSVTGGDLMRAVGFWAPPGFIHLYIDDVWEHLITRLGIGRRRDDVVIEEMHYSVGKGLFDETYERRFQGQSYADRDRMAFADWVGAPATAALIASVRHRLRQEGALSVK